MSQSSGSQASLQHPYRNANIDANQAYQAPMPFATNTLGTNVMPLSEVQRTSTPWTVNYFNEAATGDFEAPPPLRSSTWSGTPNLSSQYGSPQMQNRIWHPSHTAMIPSQAYGYSPSQRNSGVPNTHNMQNLSLNDSYDNGYNATVPERTSLAYNYTAMASEQPSFSNHTTTAGPGEFDYGPTYTSPGAGYDNFHNNFRSVDEQTTKPPKGTLWGKVRSIMKFVSGASLPKCQMQIERKSSVLTIA